jgi:hypothetical protein
MSMKSLTSGGFDMATHPKKTGREGIRQHKCFFGGGDQGTLSLQQCAAPSGWQSVDPGTAYEGEVSFKKGGLVTKGSKKEKSRLKGSFKVV